MHAHPIQTFGKYQILERIASGGMAEIYKARLEGIGGFQRLFAIKRVRPEFSSNPEFIEMLVDEAKIAGLLSHANIVQILDLGEVDGAYFVAMEYVDGRDLGAVLRNCVGKGITLPVPHAVFTCIEILKGLEYAHYRQVMRGGRAVPLNIVHRDISPSNVLVSFQGEVKLTDFGIAKANVKALETVSGVIKGRFDYMSPEQAQGGNLDHRTDLFAAGVVLYEMLVGFHPFRQKTEVATLQAIRTAQYQQPSHANPDVPYSLEVILEQALALNPEERFQSATAFKNALDKFFHDAGFIFSHSTLAAFLKGLYPEASRRNLKLSPDSVHDQETVPLDPSMLLDDEDLLELATHDGEDRPTVLSVDSSLEASGLEHSELSAIMSRSTMGDATSHFGPAPVPPDDETLIRKMPVAPSSPGVTEIFEVPESESNNAPVAAALEWCPTVEETEDQATEVVAKLAVNLAEDLAEADQTQTRVDASPGVKARSLDGPSAPPAGDLSEEPGSEATWAAVPLPPRRSEGPSDGSPTHQGQRPDLPPVGKQGHRARSRQGSSKKPRKAGRTTTFLAVFFLCGGVVGATIGFFLGLVFALKRDVPVEDVPVAQFPPRLHVFAPEGSSLLVDGDQVGLSVDPPTVLTLTADRPTVVRVELGGHQPYQGSYTLQANDLQVLHLDMAQLEVLER